MVSVPTRGGGDGRFLPPEGHERKEECYTSWYSEYPQLQVHEGTLIQTYANIY